jgi:hypothetical protein
LWKLSKWYIFLLGECIPKVLKTNWHKIELVASDLKKSSEKERKSCPEGKTSCPLETTCCIKIDGNYTCCPYNNGKIKFISLF